MQSLHIPANLTPFVSSTRRPHRTLHPFRLIARSVNGSPQKNEISEDVLQRLRIAEEEAAKLREELAKAKAEALAKV